MDEFNTHQVTMGIEQSMKQQNSKQKRHIAPKSKEFRSWILRKVIDNGKNNSLNIWILDDPKIWGTKLNRREVVMIVKSIGKLLIHQKNFFWKKQLSKEWFARAITRTARADDNNNNTHLFPLLSVNKFKSFLLNLRYKTHG